MQSGGPQPRQATARRTLLCALVAGVAFIVVPGALAAADDDPVPTPPATTTPTPTPAPEPAPDPAPPIPPKPKPTAKPAPVSHAQQASTPVRSPSRPTHVSTTARWPAAPPVRTYPRVYHAPAIRHRQPVTAVKPHAHRPSAARHKPTVRPKHKSKVSKRAHRRAKHRARRTAHVDKTPTSAHTGVVPQPQPRRAAAASIPLANSARLGSGGPTGSTSFLIVLGLLGAIACFALALVPATYMRWRPAVIFTSERHLGLTVAGAALLMLAACMLVLGRVV